MNWGPRTPDSMPKFRYSPVTDNIDPKRICPCIRDDEGRMRTLILEEVQIRFDGNLDLQIRYDKLVNPAKSDGAYLRAFIESKSAYVKDPKLKRTYREGARMDEQGEEAAGWRKFLEDVGKWATEDGYRYDRQKVYVAVLHQYASLIQDYTKFWEESGAKIRE